MPVLGAAVFEDLPDLCGERLGSRHRLLSVEPARRMAPTGAFGQHLVRPGVLQLQAAVVGEDEGVSGSAVEPYDVAYPTVKPVVWFSSTRSGVRSSYSSTFKPKLWTSAYVTRSRIATAVSATSPLSSSAGKARPPKRPCLRRERPRRRRAQGLPIERDPRRHAADQRRHERRAHQASGHHLDRVARVVRRANARDPRAKRPQNRAWRLRSEGTDFYL